METISVVLSNDELSIISQGDQLILSDQAKQSYTVQHKLADLLESIFIFDSIAGGALRVYDQNGDSHIFASERFIKINLDESCVILKPKNEQEKIYLNERLVDSIYFAEYNDEYNLFIFPEEQSCILDLASELDHEFNYGIYNDNLQGFYVSPYFVG